MNTKPIYLVALTLAYFLVSLIGILHHELWLDEAHHWLLARDSNSFRELIRNARYEGHPLMWNVMLFWITRLTLNPFWMQLLHILISTAVVFIFIRKAPFVLLFKILFIFGYFMIFEYNLISRNYIVGVLFLFLACSVFNDRRTKFMLLCFFLALAANVHLMFFVIACALFLTLLFENYSQSELFTKRNCNIGYGIFSLGLLMAFIQIIPPDDTRFFLDINKMPISEKLIKGFISLFKGLITIPDFTSIHFWNSNLIVNMSKPIAGVLGILAYAIPLILFKSRKTLFFVYIALLFTQIFFFVTQRGATRFDGMTYIIIIVGLWIDNYYVREPLQYKTILNLQRFDFAKKPIVYALLAIHFFSGIYAYSMDIRNSFTSSKETFELLQAGDLLNRPIISVTCDGTALSPYLQKKMWFLCDVGYQSFCRWEFCCTTNISQDGIISLLTDYTIARGDGLYVSSYPLINNPKPNVWTRINGNLQVRFLKNFDDTIIRNSGYYIFEIAK